MAVSPVWDDRIGSEPIDVRGPVDTDPEEGRLSMTAP